MRKPLDVLNSSRQKQVLVVIRGNRRYRGILDGYDPHMNLVLKQVEEVISNPETGEQTTQNFSLTILRGDNVIYVSPSEEVSE